MACRSFRRDDEASIRTLPAQPHGRQSAEARIIRQPCRPSCRAAQVQPVQRGATAGLEIRLLPHAPTLDQTPAQGNPVSDPGAFRDGPGEAPAVCLPVPVLREAETSTEIGGKISEPMQKLLSLLQSVSDHFADFGRNSTRRVFKPVLLLIGVAIGYVMLQPAERAAVWNSFKRMVLEDDVGRRLQDHVMQQAELHQFTAANKLIEQLLQSMLERATGVSPTSMSSTMASPA
jgi:hypothetical protein